MTAKILKFPDRQSACEAMSDDPKPLPLPHRSQAALNMIRQAQAVLRDAKGIDRRRSGIRRVNVLLWVATKALEDCPSVEERS